MGRETGRAARDTPIAGREAMASDSFLDQMKSFGSKLGLPKVDVDKLVEMNRKNFEALMKSASVAGEGAKALAEKQREILQAAFKETSARVQDFHPVGNPQEILAKQAEYAKKAFEVAMQNTRDLAELATKTTAEATKIVRDRIHENLNELQQSVSSAIADKTGKKDEPSEAAQNSAHATEARSQRPKKR
jgi:phasin family protein